MRDAPIQQIKVNQVFDPKKINAVSVPQEEALKDVITRFARDAHLRYVFAVDPINRFSGVITRNDLLKWTHLQLGSGTGSVNISPKDVYRMASATKAKDLAVGDWQTMGVRLEDDLATALKQILEYEEIDIPVLDKEGKILGDLRLSPILFYSIRSK
jgi:Mg/Co/Ni transporter MgtE